MAECTFCAIARGEQHANVVLADERCMAFLDHRPVFKGHCLLIPRAHHATLSDLPPDLVPPVFANAQRLARALEQALGADGTLVAINNRVSQSVAHLHVHIVPRRHKDGLRGFFWPRVRYADQAELEATAARILEALESP